MILFVSLSMLLIIFSLFFLMFLLSSSSMIISFKMMQMNFFGDMEILFNIWSFLFLLMVIIISTSVVIFSCSYMSGLMVNNFMFLYFSFIFSMLWLVLMNNFYWMMFGWDGLGVVSFLLIIFYMNYESINNGLFTLFQNRVGDLFFVLFMIGLLNLNMWNSLVLKWGLIFLIFGSAVKSAQFPFSSWLLAAMSAPTPISSLVHSSTLVVAGVYILLQFSYCLCDCLSTLQIISIVSLMISSFGLLNEFDMKKLIAYSTMNHVSLMMYFLSFKLYKIVYFHLNIHAMFKSLMFMCFGFVMLSSFHAQDKRLVNFINVTPVVKLIYYFSCFCLAGLPFLSAFFSKDFMIEKLMEFNLQFLYVFLLLLFLSISVYYSLKLLKLSYYMFSLIIVEKSLIGLWSVILMTIVMMFFVNIFISLVFSVTFEIFYYKMMIYFFILIFFILSLFSNLSYKIFSYDKFKNFNEIWFMNFYIIDKFMFWNFFVIIRYLNLISSVKMFLLMNWWVMILLLFVF